MSSKYIREVSKREAFAPKPSIDRPCYDQPLQLMNHEDQMHPQNKLEKCLHARQLHQIYLLIDPDGVMTMPLYLLRSKMVLSPDLA